MKSLNISISEVEYKKFKLKNQNLTFSEFVDIISKELSRQNLYRCIELADKYGLSDLSMNAISKEVKAVRKHAKDHN
ncbi:MAG: hypothetical protein WCL14_10070 [Bacteroidota bacterium]